MGARWRIDSDAAKSALAAASSLAGVAWFASTRWLWFRPAAADQVAGFAKAHGQDPHGPLLLIAGVILFAALGAWGGWLAGRWLCDGQSQPWAYGASLAAALAVPWLATDGQSPAVLALCVLCIGGFIRLRRLVIGVSWSDLSLLPALLPLQAATVELFPGLTGGACLVMSVVALLAVRIATRSARTMLLCPLGVLLETRFASDDEPARAAIAIAFVLVVPFITVLVLRRRELSHRNMRRIQFVLYPIVLVAYAHMMLSTSAPTINLYEHGINLAAASELLHGKALYRDVFPTHGPLAEGLIDLAGMKLLGPTAGAALTFRYWIALLNVVALFAVGAALSRSPVAGFLGVLLDLALYPSTVWSLGELSPILFLRAGASFAALALAICAVRIRDRDEKPLPSQERSTRWYRLMIWRWSGIPMITAGAMATVAGLVSADFGVYAAAAVAAAVWVSTARLRALVRALIGGVLALVPFALYISYTGTATGFCHHFLVVEPSFLAAYGLGYFTPSHCCGGVLRFPDVLLLPFGHVAAFAFIGWVVVLIGWCVVLTRPSRRLGPLFVTATWMVVSAVSYAERTHEYYSPLLAPLFVAVSFTVFRRYRAAILIALALIASLGFHFLHEVPAAVRLREIEVPKVFATYPQLSRAGNALFVREDLPSIDRLRQMISSQVAPNETFYTFTNLVVFHFLFDKPMPLPYEQVPMYELPSLQDEMAARLERDSRVRVVVQHFPYWSDTLDGVPNETRVPRLYQAIARDFPLVAQWDGIVLRMKQRR